MDDIHKIFFPTTLIFQKHERLYLKISRWNKVCCWNTRGYQHTCGKAVASKLPGQLPSRVFSESIWRIENAITLVYLALKTCTDICRWISSGPSSSKFSLELRFLKIVRFSEQIMVREQTTVHIFLSQIKVIVYLFLYTISCIKIFLKNYDLFILQYTYFIVAVRVPKLESLCIINIHRILHMITFTKDWPSLTHKKTCFPSSIKEGDWFICVWIM